ncbi:MAG: thioredoxin family protein [Pirellulaceae bacterium]
MRARLLTALIVVGCCTLGGNAFGLGKFNDKLSVGDKAPAFEKLPAADGKQYASSDFDKAKVLVVVFTCNSCPYAVDYEDRLIAFDKQHRGGDVALVAINCNLVEADSLENMQARAEEKGFRFPYLFDKSQNVARQYGALRTPECYVLDQDRKVVYMGAFDDNTKAELVKQQYVAAAVEAALKKQTTEVAETPPVGCLIRFKRTRRE